MALSKSDVREYAVKIGIDLIGFAGRERFEGLDAGKNPFSIAPEAKTVIVVGKRITRGTLRGVEEGSNFGDYAMFGMHWLDMDYVAEGCYNLVRFIEDAGFEAVPVFSNPSQVSGFGRPVREGAPAPDVIPDFNYAATACGLGSVGLNGLFLSNKFGPRQKFQMIITDAEFASDPLVNGPCDGCGDCVRACPLGALGEGARPLEVAGIASQVAELDVGRCAKCKNGAYANRVSDSAEPDRCAALCSRACMIHLEESGLIESRFVNAFRQRKPWAVDVWGRNVPAGE